MATENTIPATILSGTLGAGKTTLLNNVLDGGHGRDVAVLVNDVGDINVDAEIVERHTDEEVVELSNGCICCGLQGELEQSLLGLAIDHEFEFLLIEPSGISEPAPVAKQIFEGRPSTLYDLHSVTTVVDARQFYDAFENGQPKRRGEDRDGVRPISDLIVEGVEFCDTLVVNKTDLVSETELDTVRADLRALQPDATLIQTEFGDVDPSRIVETESFDRERVERSARWRKIFDAEDAEGSDGSRHDNEASRDHRDGHDNGDGHDHREDHANGDGHDHAEDHDHSEDHGHGAGHDHRHPPEVYGVDSFVYQSPRPMHPGRLAAFLRETPESLIRAKGWLHVAGRPDHALELSLAGEESRVTVAGRWIASLPERRQRRYRERRNPNWTETYGDRETNLVLIGRRMDTDNVERLLEECQLTTSERQQDGAEFENPFPARESEQVSFSRR